MIKIRILTDKVQTLKGVGKTSGKPYELHIQTGYAYTVDADGAVAEIPEKFEFILPSDEQGLISKPLPRGDYTIGACSFFVDRNGRLALNPRFVAQQAAK